LSYMTNAIIDENCLGMTIWDDPPCKRAPLITFATGSSFRTMLL
jgi:hypothetical protein